MATLLGAYDYYLWTNDNSWLSSIWSKYKLGMSFIISKIDSTGMLYVTGNNDWGRLTQGGYNTEANMILYKVLTSGSQLATWMNDSSNTTWAGLAATLQTAVNNNNYNTAVGYDPLTIKEIAADTHQCLQ